MARASTIFVCAVVKFIVSIISTISASVSPSAFNSATCSSVIAFASSAA